jgi:hypothetical protein
MIEEARLISFNAATRRAVIQLTQSPEAYLEEVAAALDIPAAEMQAGRKLLVCFPGAHNAKSAVITSVFV